jgi:hypothetical protein
MGLLSTITNFINPSTVDDLKSTIGAGGGLARTNRFVVIITPPRALNQSLLNINISDIATNLLSGGFSLKSLINDPRDIALLCESCSIPGKQMETEETVTMRKPYKVASGYSFEDVQMSFIGTNDYRLKKMFDAWQALAVDPVTYRLNYARNYKSTVIIQQLNTKNLPTFGVTLVNAFPVAVNSVEFSNTEDNAFVKINVTFNFDEIETASGLKSGLLGIKNQIGSITRLI